MTRDWTQIAKDYARSSKQKSNKDKFGKWTKLACQRFLDDLGRSEDLKNRTFYYSNNSATDVCEFASKLPHVEGKWKTDLITLEPFQVFFLCNLFGFRNLNGTRRFTSALYASARKSAKSTLAGLIGLYCLTMEGEKGPQVISAATTGDQAAIVFNSAKRMVEKMPDLQDAFRLEPFMRAIACYENGGMMRPINAKASTQDGLNPSCIILDEIHAHKSHDLVNVLQSAAGARQNPLFLYTTTEGYESPGPWSELRKFAQQVLDGAIMADHFFCVFYAIDDADDEFDEKIWAKANPLIEASPLLMDAIRKDAIDAKSMPGRHGEYLIKRMNRQAATSQGWIDLQKWKACAGTIDLESLKDEPCYGALDLASTRDLCSFRLVWDIKKTLVTIGWRWVPTATVALRAQRNLVPYAGWVRAGHIIETPGDVTDYDVVMKKVIEVSQEFKLVKVGYDAWNAAQVAQKLTNEGIEMEMFIQGPKSYHPAMKYFEEAYCDKRFLHNSDPVLTWCASNLVPRTDQNMNMAPDKKRSADKIDDMTALLMAVGIMTRQEDLGDIDAFLSDPLVLR
jgi:phage terminase large subunit-like protein